MNSHSSWRRPEKETRPLRARGVAAPWYTTYQSFSSHISLCVHAETALMYATCRFSLYLEPCELHAAALMLNASAVAKMSVAQSAWNVSTCSSEPGGPAPGMPSSTAFRSSAAYQPRSLSFSTTNKPKNTARIVRRGLRIVKDVRRCFVRSFAVRRDDVRRGERARRERSEEARGERLFRCGFALSARTAKEDAPSKFTGFTDGRVSLLTSGRTSSEMTEEDIARVSARPALRAGNASTSSAAQKTSER